jgi:hypothetical protein
MTGGSHGSQDLIGYLISSDISKPARQSAGHHGSPAAQKPSKEVGRFRDHRQS